jgi:hypothetical protein
MNGTQMTRDEIAKRGEMIYERAIRSQVETPENVGRMAVIDIETEDFEVEASGVDAARRLRSRHPDGTLYGKRIGYDVAEAIGGVLERTFR